MRELTIPIKHSCLFYLNEIVSLLTPNVFLNPGDFCVVQIGNPDFRFPQKVGYCVGDSAESLLLGSDNKFGIMPDHVKYHVQGQLSLNVVDFT